jgi:hypothetical protein
VATPIFFCINNIEISNLHHHRMFEVISINLLLVSRTNGYLLVEHRLKQIVSLVPGHSLELYLATRSSHGLLFAQYRGCLNHHVVDVLVILILYAFLDHLGWFL